MPSNVKWVLAGWKKDFPGKVGLTRLNRSRPRYPTFERATTSAFEALHCMLRKATVNPERASTLPKKLDKPWLGAGLGGCHLLERPSLLNRSGRMCGLTCLVFWWAIGPSAVVLDSILANRHLIITEHTYETLHFDFFGTSPRDAACHCWAIPQRNT